MFTGRNGDLRVARFRLRVDGGRLSIDESLPAWIIEQVKGQCLRCRSSDVQIPGAVAHLGELNLHARWRLRERLRLGVEIPPDVRHEGVVKRRRAPTRLEFTECSQSGASRAHFDFAHLGQIHRIAKSGIAML